MSRKGKLITKEEVLHIAQLANLTLSGGEVKLYTKQLKDVLGYIEKLAEVDTSNVVPTYQTLDGTTNVFRDDQIGKGLTQDEALSQAVRKFNGYFVARHVFSKGKNEQVFLSKVNKRKANDEYNAVLTKVDEKGSVGYKDLFMTKGVETTAGSAVLEGYHAQFSSTIVKRLERRGYKTKVKLNQDAWGHGGSGENSDYGPTKNPWDITRVPGGSSSGSAVAVAAGIVGFATGTDTGGSVRLPASYTNTTGIKPTYGALSRYGVIAFASSLDCPGIIGKSVSEVRKYFEMVSGSDGKDATSQSNIKDMRIRKIGTLGLVKEFMGEGLDKEIASLVKKAARVFERKGYKIKEVSLPNSEYSVAVYYIIAPTETSSNLARYDGIRYGHKRDYFGAEAKRRIMLGTFTSSSGYADKYYEQAARVRTLIIKDFSNTLKEVDALLTPVAATSAFKIGEKVDDPLQMYLMDALTIPASLAGLPGLALPCGFTESGLPVGMQIIGTRWSERFLFDIGEEYQKLTDWHKRKP
jgi:aspartyl-tRNA(Asn)/glutamyl-tRNA(Gln) amidotransferase subunit A